MSFQQWSSKSSLMVLLPSCKRRRRGPPSTQIRLSLAGRGGDVHFDLRPGSSNEAIAASPPQQAGENERAHTHKARGDGGSRLRRRLGLGQKPVEIAAVDALDREHRSEERRVGKRGGRL